MTTTSGSHAIVLGASLAGLLTARVLAERYDNVTLVDRDRLPVDTQHRRGVPHGRHLHGLHPRGMQLLDDLFPGLSAELLDAGAVPGDVLGDCRWLLSGHRLKQQPIGLQVMFFSRPLLEGHVRARVRACEQVRVLEDADITGLASTADHRRIIGARVVPAGGEEQTIFADLVIDATGRGSRTPGWLKQLGYQQPAEDRVEIGLGYATRTFRLRRDALGTDLLILHGGTPANPRQAALAPLERGRHMVTLGGILGDHPPTDLAGFTAFAGSLIFPDIADALVGAEPLDDGVAFRFPANARRRYERLPAYPERLLVVGDAICSFNPIYGQGMTVAAMEAAVLRDLLARGAVPEPRSWFRAIGKVVDVPWQITTGADLAYPDVVGKRTAQVRMVNSYLPKLHAAAATDVSLGRAFLRVMGMLDRPEGLLRPDRVLRVAAAHLHQRTAPVARTRCTVGSTG